MNPINRQFSNMGLLVRHFTCQLSFTVVNAGASFPDLYYLYLLKLFGQIAFGIQLMVMSYMMIMSLSAGQNDDPSGPSMDLATGSLQEKKMDVEKRGMGMMDFNGDMRKGGRGGGGMAYRSPGSKEAALGDVGSYYDKVGPQC